MTLAPSDIADLNSMATASCGRPGDVLKRVAKWVNYRIAQADVATRRRERSARLLGQSVAILRRAEARFGVAFPDAGKFRTRDAIAAKRWAVAELRAIGLSTPEIARMIGLNSHTAVLRMLGRWGAKKRTA